MELRITAESQVNPTEDQDKVERAIRNIFPSAKLEQISFEGNVIRLRGHGEGLDFLKTLRSLIKQERIRSAARSVILSGTRESQIHFYLNKQAAFAGRVSFCEPVGESPLGPISIKIEVANPDAVVRFLTSRPGE